MPFTPYNQTQSTGSTSTSPTPGFKPFSSSQPTDQSQTQSQPAPKSNGNPVVNFFKSLISAPATLAARPFQAIQSGANNAALGSNQGQIDSLNKAMDPIREQLQNAKVTGVDTAPLVEKLKSMLDETQALQGKTTDEINFKPTSGGIVAPAPENFSDVKKDVGRGVETVALGLGPVAGGAALGTGNSLEQGNNLFSTKTLTNAAIGAGGGKLLGLVGKPLMDVTGKVIGKITPDIISDVASKGSAAIQRFASDHSVLPDAISKPLNKIPGQLENIANRPFNKVSSVASNPSIKNLIKPSNSVEEATGQIVQGGAEDVPVARRTLQSIDTTGVNTYKDLQDKINSNIKPIAEQVDKELSKDSTPKKLNTFSQTIGQGKSGVKVNYVKQGINDLKSFYSKTGDAKGLSGIKTLENKSNTEGLTYKDVNDLAKIHGREINSFNANGEAASGLSKQAAENTRTGLKNISRQGLSGTKAKALDSKLSDLYHTKRLIDNQAEKVNAANQKSGKTGLVPKLIGKGIKLADTLTGSPLRAIGKEIGTVKGGLSHQEIEEKLANNLKIIKNSPKILSKSNGVPKINFNIPRAKNGLSLSEVNRALNKPQITKATPTNNKAFSKMRNLP